MNLDRSQARCSFCGRRPPEVRRMIAGPGAAYICDACLQLCNEILDDPTPFSMKALELASRPPVVIAAPQELLQEASPLPAPEPVRTVNVELEQKQQDMTLILRQIQFFQKHFEIHYLWIRPPLQAALERHQRSIDPQPVFGVHRDVSDGGRGGGAGRQACRARGCRHTTGRHSSIGDRDRRRRAHHPLTNAPDHRSAHG